MGKEEEGSHKNVSEVFPGGSVVKNMLANAEDKACDPQEKPPQWEACVLQQSTAHHHYREAVKTQHSQK